MPDLFSKISVRGFEIKNRIVMPPMVLFDYGRDDGRVTDDHVKHYEKKAASGVGMIITEATCVKRNGRLSEKQLNLWSDEYIEGFGRIADACRRHGAVVLVQIHHAGLKASPGTTQDFVAPSDYRGPSGQAGRFVRARALNADEIRSLQEDYIEAAVRAKKALFSGVELHGAHGYLISQFFSPAVNKRNDEYGGSVSNRAKIAAEIIRGIREKAGNAFIIGCRMGCNDPDLASAVETAKELERAGADMLHVSFGMIGSYPEGSAKRPQVPDGFDYNWVVYGGTVIKKNVNIPVIAVNSIGTPERADYLVRNGLADMTGVLRGLLVDDDWVGKARRNEKVRECLNCSVCSWFTSGKNCPCYERDESGGA